MELLGMQIVESELPDPLLAVMLSKVDGGTAQERLSVAVLVEEEE